MFFVEVSDGVKVAVYDYNPKGKQTVLLVHGWPLSHKMYEYQINCLLDLGYRVTALDLRGFGASDTPAGGYSYDRMANDIYEVVCALDLKDFILVGFSMGGAIVLRYMNCCRGYGVKKLILLSAAAPSWTRRSYKRICGSADLPGTHRQGKAGVDVQPQAALCICPERAD